MATTFDPKFQETEKDKGIQFKTTIYDNGVTMVADRISSIRYPETGWEDEMIKSFRATLPHMAKEIEMRKRKMNK